MRASEFVSEVKGHDFMAGHCHVMAMALKQLHPDWQIRAHVGYDDDAADDTEYRVDHVYTVAPDGTAYDCRGRFDNEQQLVGPDTTGGVDTQYVNFGPEEIKQAMLRGELKRFTKQDLANAMQVATQAGKQDVSEAPAGYKEIEFVCVNPQFPDATDPALQKKMYRGLKQIDGVVPLWQEWGDYSEGQASLSAIYQGSKNRDKILSLAKQLGVEVDLEQAVSDDYVDRARRGEHEGQQGLTERKQSPLEDFEGLQFRMVNDNGQLFVNAFDSTGGNELGHVTFDIGNGKELDPQNLYVKHKFRSQGIARTMYDFVKSKGYKIQRSWDQTDAGAGFWDKHRGEEERVWEQDVAEGLAQDVPSVLYHATYKPRLKSIQSKGLGSGGKRNWEDSQRGVVYLALDPDVAESYAETSDMVPDEWLDQIVMLKISTAGLDPNKFGIDSNVQDNAGDTIEYHGVIPVSNISLYKSGVAEEINTDIFDPAFNDTQIFDGLTYRATAEKGYDDKTYFQVKVFDSNFQQVGLAKFSPTKRGLVSAITSIQPEYQGQGLARNIYAYVRSLGNTIAPSRNQLPPGKAMWASWKKSGDAKHLMRNVAEEIFVSKDAVMGKIEDGGKIVRILKKQHSVPFSDEKNWLLIDTDPAKGNKGLGLKWVPADTRFTWVRPYRETVDENFADGRNPQDKGDSVRHGIPKNATMAELEKASHAAGRKGQLARWQLNMRRGKKK